MWQVWSVLLGFVGVWVGFAAVFRRKGWSWVVGVGGGFLAATVAFVAMMGVWVLLSPEKASPPVGREAPAVAPSRQMVPVRPSPNYVMRDKAEYGYVAELSDMQRQAGQVANQVVTFRYLGSRDGKSQLMNVSGDMVVVMECENPCRFIKVMSFVDADYLRDTIHVERLQNAPGLIASAAFSDAFAGHLARAEVVEKSGKRKSMWMDERKGIIYTPIP